MYAGNNALFNIGFAFHPAAQQNGVEVILVTEPLDIAVLNRFDDGHIAVEHVFFICNVDHVVYEAAQEVSFSKLNDLNRPWTAMVDLINFSHWKNSSFLKYNFM